MPIPPEGLPPPGPVIVQPRPPDPLALLLQGLLPLLQGQQIPWGNRDFLCPLVRGAAEAVALIPGWGPFVSIGLKAILTALREDIGQRAQAAIFPPDGRGA